MKYSDDSAMDDLYNSDSVHFGEVESDNSLDLNVKKTNEMLILENPTVIPDFFIDGVKVENI